MKGKILDYNIQKSSGIISGDDGNRYEFSNLDWKSDKFPQTNQKVDFIIDGVYAKEIYFETSSVNVNADEIKNKFNEIKNSKEVNNIMKNGIQHKFGFFISVVMLIGLFLPVIAIPFKGEYSLFDFDYGKLILFGELGIIFLFYSGIQNKILKILTIVVSVLILYCFITLIIDINDRSDLMHLFSMGRTRDINLFQLFSYGTYIMLPMTILLLITGLTIKSKKDNLTKEL